ncbi:MAG: Lon protease family protein [Thermovirgaceae bacterium]
MQTLHSLKTEDLRKRTDPTSLGLSSTRDVGCLDALIGQERAVNSISFGLEVQNKGYNIFVVGDHGSGRTTYSLERIRNRAKTEKTPDDLIYVYNFKNPDEPLAITIPAGQGKKLADHLEDLVEELKNALSKAFENSQYEDAKAQLVKEFQEKVNSLMEELRSWASGKGFAIKRTPQGFVNIPLVDEEEGQNKERADGETENNGTPMDDQKQESGQPKKKEMQQEDFEALSDEEKKSLQETSEEVSQKTLEVLRNIRDKEKKLKEKIRELEGEICRTAIQPYLQETKDRFGAEGELGEWIDALTEDIIENFNLFVAAARDESGAEVDFSRYSVNVFVSNDPESGAPVIWETNPTYYNLCGKIEYESRQGVLTTDFKKIIAGAIHRANGGYLVLHAEEILRNFMSWDALKRALRTQELAVENLGEQLGVIPVSSLRPQPVQLKTKVVLIGTPWLYHLLNIYDPEFQKLFKIKADFDVDMPRTPDTEQQMACFVGSYVTNEGHRHFTADGIAELIEWSSRLAGHSGRMSTQFNKITEIIVEASAWAGTEGKEMVDFGHVRKALKEKTFRVNLLEERLARAFSEKTIRIQTDGELTGQINGLTVVDMRDHAFGHPVRITANVYMGTEGIVNIEREVKMTGPIHNKGLLILGSYLGKKYAQDMPLSLTARITFEQTYSGVEGDSASSTELYCLLSALSDVPLKQGIAVTGSVDQHGNIQSIGGVNEKIEGFFEYCRIAGFTGKQGVLIPRQNIQNLMLGHDVIEAVKEGKFHIWPVGTIDEGIEILTGVPAGEPDENGCYPPDSIHGKAMSKLHGWMKKAARLRKDVEALGEACRSKGEEENGQEDNGQEEDNGSTGNS